MISKMTINFKVNDNFEMYRFNLEVTIHFFSWDLKG